MNDFVDACLDQSVHCGIFTNSQVWMQIFGKNQPYTYPSDKGIPLWVYPGDPAENFDTYSVNQFGGWEVPYAKQQVAGNYYSTTCGLYYLGQNWAPSVE